MRTKKQMREAAARMREAKAKKRLERVEAGAGVVEIPLPAVMPPKPVPGTRRPHRQNDVEVLGELIAATFVALMKRRG